MPIPGVVSTPDNPGGPGAPDIPSPVEVTALPPSVRTAISWIDARGREVMLTGNISGNTAGVIVQPGIKGFDAPPYTLNLDEQPSYDGASLRSVRATSRELFLPLFLWAPTRGQLVALKHDLVARFVPKFGPGTLKVVETDDFGNTSDRFIDCYYSGGMEGDEQESGQFVYCTYGLILKATDSWWYGDPITQNYNLAGSVPINFFTGKPRGAADELTGPFLPFDSISKVWLATGEPQTISIAGDVETWPVWRIESKGGAQFTMTNLTTGKGLILNYDFTSGGDVVTIDTRPGKKTAVNQAGVNMWPFFGPNPKLWEFLPGDNLVSFAMTLAGGANSTTITGDLGFTYKPRYSGA